MCRCKFINIFTTAEYRRIRIPATASRFPVQLQTVYPYYITQNNSVRFFVYFYRALVFQFFTLVFISEIRNLATQIRNVT